jgi:hypothetical protein
MMVALLAPFGTAQITHEAGAQYSALQPIRTAQGSTVTAPRPQDPDPLLDLPALSKSGATVLGGTIAKLDRVRDHLTVKAFGGGKVEVSFDPRTSFVRGEQPAGPRDLHVGDRIHVETITQGTRIFAKRIHIGSDGGLGEAHGQVVSYDAGNGLIGINDELSEQPVRFRINNSTHLTGQQLAVGALVEVNFSSGTNHALAREVKVLAAPGSVFSFVGRITYLDMASHSLVVDSSTDQKKYAIKFNPARVNAWDRLHEGTNISVKARFDGSTYIAEDVAVMSTAAQ